MSKKSNYYSQLWLFTIYHHYFSKWLVYFSFDIWRCMWYTGCEVRGLRFDYQPHLILVIKEIMLYLHMDEVTGWRLDFKPLTTSKITHMPDHLYHNIFFILAVFYLQFRVFFTIIGLFVLTGFHNIGHKYEENQNIKCHNRPGAVSKKWKFAALPPPLLRHRFHVFFLFLDT